MKKKMRKQTDEHTFEGRTVFKLPQVGPCTRCGFKWTPLFPVIPMKCAGCKTPYWQIPRTRRQRKKTA